MKKHILLVICHYFKPEVNAVLKEMELPEVEVHFFPAQCGRWQLKLDKLKSETLDNIVPMELHVLGGACVTNLERVSEDITICNVHSLAQCFYMMAPRALVDNYLNLGAYLVTPGWLVNWKETVMKWGFNRKTAVQLYQESLKKIVLLDTGVVSGVKHHLQEFSAYVGLPAEHLKIGTDYLRLFLSDIILRAQIGHTSRVVKTERRLKSDYAMLLDFMLQLGDSFSEKETVQRLIDLLYLLVAPQRVFFQAYKENTPLYTWPEGEPLPDEMENIKKIMPSKKEPILWDDESRSFMIRLAYHGETVGMVYVQGLSFPEYKDQYMELAGFIQNIAGLAISHARQFDRLNEIAEELNNEKEKLKSAVENVKQLRGLLPICSYCKKIRVDEGYWMQLEMYLRDHADLEFSHGLCPDCLKKLYPEYLKKEMDDNSKTTEKESGEKED
jgi:hypothetical protein